MDIIRYFSAFPAAVLKRLLDSQILLRIEAKAEKLPMVDFGGKNGYNNPI